jgi:hypothetical protein
MNREIIMTALFTKLTAPPLTFNFRADTAAGSVVLANVNDTSGLMVGMPVMGDGLPGDAVITALAPLTISLPAVADRSASTMTQGFQTAARRLADPSIEQDMPALYLVETSEMHPGLPARGSNEPALIELHCEVWVFTKVGADQNAVPAATLNNLIDGIERALYPTPRGFRQTLGVNGVLFARIEGEVQKDPGHNGQLAGAIIPLRIVAAQSEETYLLVAPTGASTWDGGASQWDAANTNWDVPMSRAA